MSIYADTSFFVSLYLSDDHSPIAQRWISTGASLWMTPLHIAEWTHAVEQHVFRKNLSRDEATRAHELFGRHREEGDWVEIAVPERVFELCADLARRQGGRTPIRTLDSLHVACALQLGATGFWTFDERQAKLAKAEGLKVQT